MVDDNVLKHAERNFLSYQVSLFADYDVTLNQKQKKEIMEIIKLILEKKLEHLKTYYKIKKDLYAEIYTSYSDNVINFFTSTIKSENYGKWFYKDLPYPDLDSIKESKMLNFIKEYFDYNNNKDIYKNMDNLEWIFKNLKLQMAYNIRYFRPWYESEMYKTLEKITEDIQPSKELEEIFKGKHSDIGYILKVLECKDDVRIAKIYFCDRIDYIAVTPENNMYNYIDEGRPLFLNYDYDHRYTWLAFDIVSIEDLKNTISNYYAYYKANQNTLSNLNRYVDNDTVLSAKNKYLLMEAKRKREEELAKIKNKKYEEAINNLEKKPFEKNGITFTKYTMNYENILVDTNKIFDFSVYLNQKSVDELVDFNTLLNIVLKSISYKFIYNSRWNMPSSIRYNADYLLEAVEIRKPTIFTIDGKKISISYDENKYYVNDIRINKNEIAEVLTHILCYNSIEDFNKFLKSVSSCSLKFHKAISNGIKHTIHIGELTTVELKMVREKSRNYLILGKKKLKINDTNRLINWNNYDYKSFIETLINSVDIDFKDIKKLLKEGIERYNKALEKSKKLLEDTMKMLKVEKKVIDGKEGYVIQGKSGNEYLVEDKNNNYPVWKNNNGSLSYVCIVDKSSKNQMGKDGLVSRLYALKNDILIAQDVTTLKL